jgi:hypothetical protein
VYFSIFHFAFAPIWYLLQLNRSRCVAPTSMSKVHLHKVCPQLVRPAFNGVPLRALQPGR